MKILFLIIFLSSISFAQWNNHNPFINWYNVRTDSIIWKVVQVHNEGVTTCEHDWALSELWRAEGNRGCLVFHNGWHCDYDDQMINRICFKCLRKETLREQWYQSKFEKPKTLYEILDEKIKLHK